MLPAQQTPIAKFIEEHANRSPYSYAEIAILAGFKSADVLYGFMRGEFRVPLDRVAPLAGALGCDGAQLFLLALKSWFSPDLISQIEECFVAAPEDSVERTWILAIREIFDGKVPELTVKIRKRLELVLKLTS